MRCIHLVIRKLILARPASQSLCLPPLLRQSLTQILAAGLRPCQFLNHSLYKELISFFLLALSLLSFTWPKDEAKAFFEVGKTEKPLVIAFLGAEGCSSSQKFQKELLSQDSLGEMLKDKAVLLEVSQPQAARLSHLFNVTQFPCLVLVDTDGEVIDKQRFQSVAPEVVGVEIVQKLNCFFRVKAFVEQGDFSVDEKELQSLFESAKTLHNPFYAKKICEEGIKTEIGHFFLTQKYLSLLYTLPWNHPQVLKAREAVLNKQDAPASQVALTLAVIDFKRLSRVKTPGTPPSVTPLLEYVKKYRTTDPERATTAKEMVAGHFFLAKEYSLAATHIAEALEFAPERKKQELRAFHTLLQDNLCKE